MATRGQYLSEIKFPLTVKPLTSPDAKMTFQDIFNLQNSFRLLIQELDLREPGDMQEIKFAKHEGWAVSGHTDLPERVGRWAEVTIDGQTFHVPLYYFREPEKVVNLPSYDLLWNQVQILLPLDDDILDYSNNQYVVDAINSPVFVEDTPWGYGKSLQLGGPDVRQFLRINVDENTNIGNKPFVVEMWIKVLHYPLPWLPRTAVFGQYDEDDNSPGFTLEYTADPSRLMYLHFPRTDGSGQSQGMSLPHPGYELLEGNWVHLAIVKDRIYHRTPNLRLYLNGDIRWELGWERFPQEFRDIIGPWLIGSREIDPDGWRTQHLHALISNFRLTIGNPRYGPASYDIPVRPFPTGEVREARFWRIIFDSTFGSTSHVSVAEIEFNTKPQQGTGTPIASSDAGAGWEASKGFDGIKNTDEGWKSQSGDVEGSWLGFEFDDPVGVVQAYVTLRQTELDQAPKELRLQFSEDGYSWNTLVSSEIPTSFVTPNREMFITAATVHPQ